jgi:8-hydroxy-5-deazaflavin:NADPH oxidoreductase
MKIGILGSGNVGRKLGDGFIELGHMVKIGTRDPNKGEVIQWVSKHDEQEGKASSGTLSEAASFGEIVGIATSWDGTSNAIKLADPKNLARKVVIDVTNPGMQQGIEFTKAGPAKVLVSIDGVQGQPMGEFVEQASFQVVSLSKG